MSFLVLLRHGQSQWNMENRFTGWTDVPLTDRGRQDAEKSAEALRDINFQVAFTSRLRRASDTLDIVLKALGQKVPIVVDSVLNERHYGDLQGLNKLETAEKYGQDQVKLWRRSYETRPPNGESLEDCERRVMPFYTEYILSRVQKGENVLVVASANSMRPMFRALDNLDTDTMATFEVLLCTPYIYTFDGKKLMNKEIREVEGIVTLGASITQSKIEEGRV